MQDTKGAHSSVKQKVRSSPKREMVLACLQIRVWTPRSDYRVSILHKLAVPWTG